MPFRPIDQEQIAPTSSFKPIEDTSDKQLSAMGNTGIVEKYVSPTFKGIVNLFANLGFGALKGVASTATGIVSMAEKGMKAVMPKSVESAFGFGDTTTAEQLVPEQYRTPEGTVQKIGFGAEQVAEFLVPSTKIAKLEKGMNIFTRMATEAGVGGTQRLAQTSGDIEQAGIAAIVSGLFPVVGAGLSALKSPIARVGKAMQQSKIRPNAKDLSNGFKIENVNKYKVGGSLNETVLKTHQEINKRVNQLQSLLKETDNKVNVDQVFNETIDELQKQKTAYFGSNEAIKRVATSLKNELDEVAGAGENRIVNLVDATNIKRGAGAKGAWANGRFDPDADATETVYDIFYNKLKTAIEIAEPSGKVKQINKEISELIPISNAVLRRLPVEQRNNVISLTDNIGLFSALFDPKALALVGANRLSKSGKFGAFLAGLGEKQVAKTGIGKRVFGDVEPHSFSASEIPQTMKVAKPVAKPLSPLIQEAKKYKSAEEFARGKEIKPILDYNKIIDVKATEKTLPKISEGYTRFYRAESPDIKYKDVWGEMGMSLPKDFVKGDSFHLTPDLKYVKYYQDTYGKNAKISYFDLPKGLAKESDKFAGEFTVTKSQLTDFWNEANKIKK